MPQQPQDDPPVCSSISGRTPTPGVEEAFLPTDAERVETRALSFFFFASTIPFTTTPASVSNACSIVRTQHWVREMTDAREGET